MRLIDGDELYQKVVGYNGGAVDKTVAKRLIDQMPTVNHADVVSRKTFEQIKWERYIAVEQLKELGYGLGEKIHTEQPEIIRCKDCKHYYYADNRIPQEQRFVCDLDGGRWKPDSFCSFAERRSDEIN